MNPLYPHPDDVPLWLPEDVCVICHKSDHAWCAPVPDDYVNPFHIRRRRGGRKPERKDPR